MSSAIVEDPLAKAVHSKALSTEEILVAVQDELQANLFIDVHTHLFMPSLGRLGLWGIDELITYHYLEAELFRSSDLKPEAYWQLSKREKADAILKALFVENTPVSEATRGVVAVLNAFGLPTGGPDLSEARRFFAAPDLKAHVRPVFKLAGVSEIAMTHEPLDPHQAPPCESGPEPDP